MSWQSGGVTSWTTRQASFMEDLVSPLTLFCVSSPFHKKKMVEKKPDMEIFTILFSFIVRKNHKYIFSGPSNKIY